MGDKPTVYHKAKFGRAVLGDSLDVMAGLADQSVDLIVTSPPFGLTRKKEYGNFVEDEYLKWFEPFAVGFQRILKDTGSLVIDLGGAWKPGQPTRSLYHFKLLIMLCERFGFHLAQEFYWWNPSKLPTPAEWVNVRRIRVKDAINTIWWLSKTPWPKASNRRVLQPYSDSMRVLLANGYKAMKRPSGHDISAKFSINNGASIPPNLIALPNTDSNGYYQRYCQEHGIKAHPARFPAELPEYFIRMLTDKRDFVFDPFGGSCVTGEVCERLQRNWLCSELNEDYLKGAVARFEKPYLSGERKPVTSAEIKQDPDRHSYKVWKPHLLWNGVDPEPLAVDGGRKRKPTVKIVAKLFGIGKSDTARSIHSQPQMRLLDGGSRLPPSEPLVYRERVPDYLAKRKTSRASVKSSA